MRRYYSPRNTHTYFLGGDRTLSRFSFYAWAGNLGILFFPIFVGNFPWESIGGQVAFLFTWFLEDHVSTENTF